MKKDIERHCHKKMESTISIKSHGNSDNSWHNRSHLQEFLWRVKRPMQTLPGTLDRDQPGGGGKEEGDIVIALKKAQAAMQGQF